MGSLSSEKQSKFFSICYSVIHRPVGYLMFIAGAQGGNMTFIDFYTFIFEAYKQFLVFMTLQSF